MRILVVNSNTSEAVTARVRAVTQSSAPPGTSIDVLTAEWGPCSIEGRLDGLLGALATVELIARHRDAYDGFVIACYSDPGLLEAREVTARPVVGIAEASMLTACLLGQRFSIITVLRRLGPVLRELAARYGLAGRLASVRTTEMAVLAAAADPEAAARALGDLGRLAIEQDDAEVLCLGGAAMAGLDARLAAELGVPVLDGLSCALHQIQGLVAQGLHTSRALSLRPPERKAAIRLPADLAPLYEPGP